MNTVVKEMTIAQFNKKQEAEEDFVVIDVREDHEWEEGHITDALHIKRGNLETEIEGAVPNKSSLIILYCRSGGRSTAAAQMLQQMGYENVYSLQGGITAYLES